MKLRLLPLLCVLFLAVSPAAEAAKKKGSGKRETPSFGPVRTVAAQGNPATGTPTTTEPSTATATCPKGTRVVGGGFSAPATLAVQMIVEQSFRSSARSWTAVGNAVIGTSAMTAYAYCRKASTKITEVANSTIAGGFLSIGTTSATCPPGARPISGGFQATRGPTSADIATAQESIPAGRSWRVSIVTPTAAAQGMIVYAYCVADAKTKVRRTTQSSVNVPAEAAGSAASRTCPKPKGKGKGKGKRMRMSSGGFAVTFPTSDGPALLIGENRLVGGRWRVGAFNVNLAGPAATAVAGVCL